MLQYSCGNVGRKSKCSLSTTNWSGKSLTIGQGTVMEDNKVFNFVNSSDPVWETPTVELARIGQRSEEDTRKWQAQLNLQH